MLSSAHAETIYLSTNLMETLGGLTFLDGDVVSYDTETNVATPFIQESIFDADNDIDAVFVAPNGQKVISTGTTAVVNGVTLRDGDLVVYDPVMGTASVLLSESLFAAEADIDAVHRGGD